MKTTYRSKRYRACLELIQPDKAYSLPDAVETLKKLPPTKFDQTVTLSFKLGVDPKQSDQMVRGTCPLPHGSGKQVAVATPAAMAEVRKLGRVLGPRGLMPNPKTGTVTDDTAKAVREVKAGRVEFKLDKNGNVAVPMGKFSFAPQALVENGTAVIDAVVKARPAHAKGKFVHTITVSATMTPGLSVDPSVYLK